MHEVELIKRIRFKLGTAADINGPNLKPPSEETVRRVTFAALEILGIKIEPDGRIATTTPADRLLRQAALINSALANGYTPMGFTQAELDLAAQLRREMATPSNVLPENA